MIEPTSTTSGADHLTLREFELWQKSQANEAILRQRMLEEARDALEKLVNSRFDAAQTALTLALTNHDRRLDEHQDTLLRERGMVRDYLAQLREADQVAISKAEQAVSAKLEGMNELRAQISSERAEFVRQDTYSARHDELIARINALEQSQVGVNGQVASLATALAPIPGQVAALREGASNIAGRMTIIAFGVTVFLTFVTIAANWIMSKV